MCLCAPFSDFAILFAKALGAKVIVFSHSANKKDDCLKILGADEFVVSGEEGFAKPYADKIDYMLSTANAAKLPLEEFLTMLKVDGKFTSVGLPEEPWDGLKPGMFNGNASCLSSSHIGSKVEA